MATNLSTCHSGDGIEPLSRLPELAGPLLQIDLERELQQLQTKDSWQRETGRSSKTLAKLSGLPNCSNSHEERHSNATA